MPCVEWFLFWLKNWGPRIERIIKGLTGQLLSEFTSLSQLSILPIQSVLGMEPDQRTYSIIGAAMLIHRELARGLLEVTYQTALAEEFAARGIPFRREVPIEVWFRGKQMGGTYRADFECFGEILLELKAIPRLGRTEVSQLSHYLAATGRPLGLLLNFGGDSLQFQRVLSRRSTLVGPQRTESAELRLAVELQGFHEGQPAIGSAESKAPST
ncbi:MAG: GxxExxY protein [Candidatus Thermoplasmatota archaeon]